jgi:cytochrome P450
MTTRDQHPSVDLDQSSPAYFDDRHGMWAGMRDRCPVAHSDHHGGFWAVANYEGVARVSRESDTFTVKYEPGVSDGIRYSGITGPLREEWMPAMGISEVDGPVHRALRMAINPHMLPLAVAKLRPFMEQVTTWVLDQWIERGVFDLVQDFASPIPALTTMRMLGMPYGQWEHYGEFFHGISAYGDGDPRHEHAVSLAPAISAEFVTEVHARRESPGDDLLSDLVRLEVPDERTGGRRALTDDELVSILYNLVGGGLDTTTSLTALALYHLDEHPDLRGQLVAHPELLATATEEFLRFFSVNETLWRTVTEDVELCGQQLQRGDFVFMSWLSANRDEAVFERADEVVLDRAPNPHLAFGIGAHKCIGMHLARTMFQVMVTEVLTRMPDYRVDRAATRFYSGNPTLTGVVTMPATFTPGRVTGPAEPPF